MNLTAVNLRSIVDLKHFIFALLRKNPTKNCFVFCLKMFHKSIMTAVSSYTISTKTKARLFKSLVELCFTYGSEVWTLSQRTKARICIIENRFGEAIKQPSLYYFCHASYAMCKIVSSKVTPLNKAVRKRIKIRRTITVQPKVNNCGGICGEYLRNDYQLPKEVWY